MLNPCIIPANEEITPSVMLDAGKGTFEISGWSHPEDSMSFYAPVLNWLNKYAESPNAATVFNFRFQYFNTSSAKQVFRTISALEDVSKKSNVTIRWHYDNEDTDMRAAGERFAKMSTVPFVFISN